MTTVACNTKSLATDLQFTYGTQKMKGKCKTVVLEGDKAKALLNTSRAIIGFSGLASQFSEFIAWCLSDELKKPPKLKKIELLALTKEGKIYHGEGPTHWMHVDQPFFAIGSGSHFAMGALQHGASPLEAVKAASKHCAQTGMGFQEFHL